MAKQFSTTFRNNSVGQFETTVGASAKLRIYTGSAPAACADAATGTLLCTIDLPSDWLTAASGGAVSKNGVWSGTAGATGTAGYYRIWDSTATTCHEQGTCGQGTGDLSLDNTSIANGQTVTVSTWTLTQSGA